MKQTTTSCLQSIGYICCLLVFLLGAPLYAQSTFPDFPPAGVTSLIDRNRMMHQLGICFPTGLPGTRDDSNRPACIKAKDSTAVSPVKWTDAQGYLPESPAGYRINRTDFGLWLNYTEQPSQLGVYTPIDLLEAADGTEITTPGQWWGKRRPELLLACQRDVWGVIPAGAAALKVSWSDSTCHKSDGFGNYVERHLEGVVDKSGYPPLKHTPVIKAVLRLPEGAKGKIPVIIRLEWPDAKPEAVSINECLSRGWGLLTMDCSALQPDSGQYLTDYLIGLVNKGNWRKPQDWGTLAAWSWGVSRLLDFFEKDTVVDARRIGIAGHSRYGKAALVAMAYEPRLAVGYVSCSGALGAAPIRRNCGEDIESLIWEKLYHWTAGNFMKWMGALHEGAYMPRKCELLTVDAHALLSLCAPRPVLITGGTEDSWTDAYGMYLTCRDASPVYKLLGAKGVNMPDAQPIPGKDYTDGDIAYRCHVGGHIDTPDWGAFARFAARYLEVGR